MKKGSLVILSLLILLGTKVIAMNGNSESIFNVLSPDGQYNISAFIPYNYDGLLINLERRNPYSLLTFSDKDIKIEAKDRIVLSKKKNGFKAGLIVSYSYSKSGSVMSRVELVTPGKPPVTIWQPGYPNDGRRPGLPFPNKTLFTCQALF